MRTPQAVQSELLALLPGGFAWNHDADSMVANSYGPLAAEISRFEGFADEQLIEVDPREAVYMLPDFERVLGPDPAGRDLLDLPISTQQQIAYQRWTFRGGQSIAFFTALAASIGDAITITEYRTSQCGLAQCGASSCVPSPNQFYWTVTLPETDVQPTQCGGAACGAAFCGGIFTASLTAGLIAADAPAHTQPIFSYTG